jgi:hypothetical protein
MSVFTKIKGILGLADQTATATKVVSVNAANELGLISVPVGVPSGTDQQTLRYDGTTLKSTSIVKVDDDIFRATVQDSGVTKKIDFLLAPSSALAILQSSADIDLQRQKSPTSTTVFSRLFLENTVAFLYFKKDGGTYTAEVRLTDGKVKITSGNIFQIDIPSKETNKVLMSDDVDGNCTFHPVSDVGMITKDLTNNADNNLFEVALPSGEMTSGEIHYVVKAGDGTNYELFVNTFRYIAINDGATIQMFFQNNEVHDYVNRQTTYYNGLLAVNNVLNSGSMTGGGNLDVDDAHLGIVDFGLAANTTIFTDCQCKTTAGTNKITISVNPAWSGTSTLLKIHYKFIHKTPEVITYL